MPGHSVDQRVAWRDVSAGETYFFHADLQGSVQAVVDTQYVYTPFGVQAPLDATGNPFRDTGRRYDPESGLYYYRARYYDAVHGRFLQTDPVGYADQMNLYTYVANDPLNATDPTGMCTFCIMEEIEVQSGETLYNEGGLQAVYDDATSHLGIVDTISGNRATHIHEYVAGVTGELWTAAENGGLGPGGRTGSTIAKGTVQTGRTTIGVFGQVRNAIRGNINRKMDFFFGKATGSAHNIQRSQTMQSLLAKIGIHNDKSGRSILRNHLKSVRGRSDNISEQLGNGRVKRESILNGPGGQAKVKTIWEDDKLLTGVIHN